MEKMAYRLNKLGLDEVYIAMHIYKFSVEPEVGNELMAAGWYRSLAGDAARPEILEGMFARSYDIRARMQAYIAWRRATVEDFR